MLQRELGEANPITWDAFKEVFLEQYFPWIIRKNKAQEFADLVQGSMTIEQYQVKFIELSHFAPYLIPNEISKA